MLSCLIPFGVYPTVGFSATASLNLISLEARTKSATDFRGFLVVTPNAIILASLATDYLVL